jgi:hypothetical protein
MGPHHRPEFAQVSEFLLAMEKLASKLPFELLYGA